MTHPCSGNQLQRGRRGLVNRWRREQCGATAIEFALIAPAFLFLMFVIAETAMVFIAEQVMDNALSEAARLVRTGQAQTGAWATAEEDQTAHPMSEAEFKEIVCAGMSVFVDCSGSDFFLDVKAYPSFAEIDTEPPLTEQEQFKTAGDFDFGGASEIVVVRAYYQWPTNNILGSLSLKNLDNGKRLIGSFAAFRNEPYT